VAERKLPRGATGETAALPDATLWPGMPAGEQAELWVTWNLFLLRLRSPLNRAKDHRRWMPQPLPGCRLARRPSLFGVSSTAWRCTSPAAAGNSRNSPGSTRTGSGWLRAASATAGAWKMESPPGTRCSGPSASTWGSGRTSCSPAATYAPQTGAGSPGSGGGEPRPSSKGARKDYGGVRSVGGGYRSVDKPVAFSLLAFRLG